MKNLTRFHLPALAILAAAAPAAAQTAGDRVPAQPEKLPLPGAQAEGPAWEAPPPALDPTADPNPDGATEAPVMPRSFLPDDTSLPKHSDEELAALGPIRPDLSVRRDVLYYDDQGETLWVRARTYKASASAEGFQYIPFLGSKAERNWPIAFRAESVTVGGEPVELSPTASVRRVGDRYVLDRGAVEVVYEIGLDQVEQLFVLEGVPHTGEIVVDLGVATDLAIERDGAGLRFVGPDGSAGYSAAIALDAAGNRVDVPIGLAEGRLTLTVPADFVAAAVGQIVIDPIITTFIVDTFGTEQRDIDVAYDATSDTYAYVYEDIFSAGDGDIFMTIVEVDGTFFDAGFVDSSSDDWRDPEIAGLNSADRLLCVATVQLPAEDPIRGRIYDYATTNFLAASFEIGDIGTSTNWSNARPDVGGNNSTAAGTQFCVVWERTFAAGNRVGRYRMVDANGVVGPLRTLPSGGVGTLVSEVRISESTGVPSSVNVWNVAYVFRDNATGDEIVRAGQLNATGSIASPVAEVGPASPTTVYRSLDVSDALSLDGLDPTYLIVYDEFGASTRDTDAIICRNSTRVNEVDINILEHTLDSLNQDDPKLSTTREDFVVSYTEVRAGVASVRVTTLDLTEGNFLAVSERRTELTQESTDQNGAAMASRASGGLNSRFIGVGWETPDAGGDIDAAGANFGATNARSPAFQYCEGAANSTGDRGFLRLEGTRSATTNKTARAEALPPFQFALLVGGTSFANVPLAGGGDGTRCLGGNLGRYNLQIQAIAANGTASFTIDPGVIPLGGGIFSAMAGDFFQWQVWHRDLNAGGQTSNFSNAVTILFN